MDIEQATAQLTGPGAPFEIGSTTIRGIETRIWKHAPLMLRDVLERGRSHGDLEFLVYCNGDEREAWTFEQHHRAVAHLAHLLRDELGVHSGDRVALAMRNYPEWSIGFWAAAAAGAVVVPLNAWWNGSEMEYGLSDSGTTVLLCDGERWGRVAPHLEATAVRRGLVTRLGANDPALPEGFRSWQEVVPAEVRDRPAVDLPPFDRQPEDPATIFYTSGTTGFPKGALGSHRNACSNVMTADFLKARGLLRTGAEPPSEQPTALLSVPLFHVTGCQSTMMPALWAGSKLVLVFKFDAEETVRLIERERVHSFGGVPTLVWRVLEAENFEQHDLSSVTRVAYGGSPAAPELVRRIQEAFPGAGPSNGYGLTETSAVASSNAGADYIEAPTSAGLPIPVCEFKVCDEQGGTLPTGEVGELWIKGPNVLAEYWNKPEASAETFTDGWLHTGDLAHLDERGRVYIVDRAKDMLIRGGENVYCAEVEAAVHEHPDVLAVAVYGVPHRVLGEEVACDVQLRRNLDPDEMFLGRLRDFTKERLAAYKVPAHWHFRQEPLPLNANGKILKRSLREQALERLGLQIDPGVAG